MSHLFDFAVTTIFAREVLEGTLIIIQYRTIIQRTEGCLLNATKEQALRAVTVSALLASLVAVILCVAVAVALALLSMNFDQRTGKVIEGISKIVAAICILQLSLKIPQWLGIYKSKKKKPENGITTGDLTLRNIRFNVAWNIWREVAECGVFLLPFFLTGENIISIPLSAVIGTLVGLLASFGIYMANKKLEDPSRLAFFTALLFVVLSAGLFMGGSHNLEVVFGSTPTVWCLPEFWSAHRLPMTIIKPFGYSDCRTILQIVCYWSWLIVSALLHYRKWQFAKKANAAASLPPSTARGDSDEEGNSAGTPDNDVSVEKGPHVIDIDVVEVENFQETILQDSSQEEEVQQKV